MTVLIRSAIVVSSKLFCGVFVLPLDFQFLKVHVRGCLSKDLVASFHFSVVTPTNGPKFVSNRCVIADFVVFLCCHFPFFFFVGVRVFCHRTDCLRISPLQHFMNAGTFTTYGQQWRVGFTEYILTEVKVVRCTVTWISMGAAGR